MMLSILWIIVILLAIVSQWYIIEKKKKYPKKLLWFSLRVVVATVFLYLYILQGYTWYAALIYMVGTFGFLFNLGLNLLRKKPLTYLSPKNSVVDKVLLYIFKYEYIIFWLSFLLLLFSIGNMVFYGKMTWYEINNPNML